MMDMFQNAIPGLTLGWLLVPGLAFVVGYFAGILHFRSLEFVVQRLVAGRLSAVALQIARLTALGFVLWLLAHFGAVALIAGALGVLVARARVLARARMIS